MPSAAASPKRSLGLFYCLAFVSLEAIQAVYFGGVFQRMDSFLLGGAIFGLASACSLLWVACRRRVASSPLALAGNGARWPRPASARL